MTTTISPTEVGLAGGEKQTFVIPITGTGDSTVRWSVSDIKGGNAQAGALSSSGLYTAPVCPALRDVVIAAVISQHRNASASANVILSGPPRTARGNHYVATNGSDSNDGSACRPWATINHADSVIGPGAVVHVAPGTYYQDVSTSASGTANAPITFISDLRWGAKLVGSSDSLWLATGSYVNIEGFDVSPASNVPRMGIYATGGTHNRIIGNRVHDVVAINGGSNGGAGIEAGPGADYSEISANFIYNIGVGTANTHTQGIYISTSQHHLVANNIVVNAVGWGVQLYHQPVGYVTIVNNTLVANGGGVLIGSDGSGSTATDYNIVSNNILAYNTSEYGLRECCSSGNVGVHNTYTNNLFYQNSPTDWQPGMTTTPVQDVIADPLFVNYQPDGSGDYDLQSGSPARGAGTSANAPIIDFDGGLRSIQWDLGAYQYGATPGTWPW